jgi:hypothetical protein
MPKGEQMGVEAYNYPLPDGTNLDPNKGSLAIAPLDLHAQIDSHPAPAADSNTAHNKWSLGDWLTSEPGADNFCTVKDPYDTEQDLKYIEAVPPGPDGGGAEPAVPAFNAKYHWNSVRFYNTPALPGTQLVADLQLTFNEGLPDGGAGEPCTGTVHVVGLWPAVDCTSDPLPDGGAPASPIDETKCSPEADPSKGRSTGSGISPDLKTRCHPDLKLCVLPGDPQTL